MKKIILFGSGYIGQKYCESIQKEHLIVSFFCDNDTKKQGGMIKGISVYSPDVLKEIEEDYIVIITCEKYKAIEQQLKDMGIQNYTNYMDYYYYVKLLKITDNRLNNQLYRFVDYGTHKICEIGNAVIILDSMDYLHENSIKYLLDVFGRYNDDCVVGSQVINKNGEILSAGQIYWDSGEIENYCSGKKIMDWEASFVRAVDGVLNSGVAVNKNLWEFWKDKIIKEDGMREFCKYLKQHNIPILYQPESVVVTERNINEFNNVSGNDLYDKPINDNKNYFIKSNAAKYRGIMLLVDSSTPVYDNHCGARVIFKYIEIFQKLNMRILFLPADFEYIENYTKELQQKGIEVIYGKEWKENYNDLLEKYLEYLDYAFLSRPEPAKMVIDILRKNSEITISYFGHDLHYLRMQRQYNMTKDEELLSEIREMKSLEYEMIKKAHYSGYPSSDEIKYLQNDGIKNVEVYPLYYFKKNKRMKRYNNKHLLFVGGFLHYPNTDGVLWFVNEVYPIMKKRGFEDNIYLVGSHVTDEISNLASEKIIVVGYVSDEKLKEFYNMCCISIAPLRIGAGVKGKILEAMYEGLPVVTTSIGAEGIQAAKAGIQVADNAVGFADRIMDIYYDCDKINEISIKEQRYIEENYGEDRLKKLFLEQIERKTKR